MAHLSVRAHLQRVPGNLTVATAADTIAARDGQPPRLRAARTSPVQRLLAMLHRQRWVLVGSFLLAIALGLLVHSLLPERYVAASSVQLEQQTPQIVDAPGLDPTPEDTNRFLQTELDRVRSRRLAMDVANAARVMATPRILAAIGVDPDAAPDLERDVIPALQEGVSTELGLNTRLARIAFASGDADVSALLANTYAEALVAANLRGKRDTSDAAQEYLLEELAEAKAKLEESERGALAYARNADITGAAAPGDVPGASQPAQQLEQLTNSLAAATARRIDAQQQWQQMRGQSAMVIPEVQQNRAIQELMAQKAQFQAALAEDLERHTEEYPTVGATRAQIAQLDGEIRSTAANIKESFRQAYLSAQAQERQLEATIGGLRDEALAERERGIAYNTLEREVETDRVAYDGLLQRLREIAAAAGAPAANVTLIDRAEPPDDPVSPSLPWNLAFAGLCGLILGAGLALVRETVFDAAHSPEEVAEALGAPVIGAIPVMTRGGDIADALDNRRSPQSEAYHSAAAALRQLGEGGPPATVLLTSAQANEGKSTSAMGLAHGLATLGRKVLVVNGDLRNPSPDAGFAEALRGDIHPFEAIRKLRGKGFWLMDSGNPGGDPVGLLSPARVGRVLDTVADRVDIVLVDGPPILGLADAPLLAECVEAVLMVCAAGKSDPSQLDAAVSRLPDAPRLAALVTRYDARHAGTEYGSPAWYSYGSDQRIRA